MRRKLVLPGVILVAVLSVVIVFAVASAQVWNEDVVAGGVFTDNIHGSGDWASVITCYIHFSEPIWHTAQVYWNGNPVVQHQVALSWGEYDSDDGFINVGNTTLVFHVNDVDNENEAETSHFYFSFPD